MRYRLALAVFFCVCAPSLCGCSLLQRPTYVPPKHYVLEPQVDVPKAEPTGKTLAVRPIEAARPYRQPVVYRESGMTLGFYQNSQWAELPAVVITRALINALEATGRFKDVGPAGDLNVPDYILTGALERFDLDRTKTPWTAIVQLRLEIRGAFTPDLVWTGTLTDTRPLAADHVAELPKAMSDAVGHVLTQAVGEIVKK